MCPSGYHGNHGNTGDHDSLRWNPGDQITSMILCTKFVLLLRDLIILSAIDNCDMLTYKYINIYIYAEGAKNVS